MRICHSFTNLIKWREKRVTSSSWLAISISVFYMINICFLVIFPLALQFSQIFIFHFHRDNVFKNNNGEIFFTVSNSRQFCTKYFCSQKRKCPVKFSGALDLTQYNQFLSNDICSFLIWKRCLFTKSRWVCSYIVESRTSWNGHPSLSYFHSLAFSHM